MIQDALLLQSRLFLEEDMNTPIVSITTQNNDVQKLLLKSYTSMIATGGSLSLMVLISFETPILDHLMSRFMDGEAVASDELEEVRDSVCGEVINTIIGLALPTFPGRGKGVTITPPITISDAASITKYKTAKLTTSELRTAHGALSISVINSEQPQKEQ
ncbi:MAG: chemotaxis protein CheX [Campylobacterales bacterium]|nr:chemotaxis protein CheX [Campylobacterales bacterium]